MRDRAKAAGCEGEDKEHGGGGVGAREVRGGQTMGR